MNQEAFTLALPSDDRTLFSKLNSLDSGLINNHRSIKFLPLYNILDHADLDYHPNDQSKRVECTISQNESVITITLKMIDDFEDQFDKLSNLIRVKIEELKKCFHCIIINNDTIELHFMAT